MKPAKRLTTAQLEKLQYALEGTCQTVPQALVCIGLDIDITVVEDQLLDQPHPIEACKGCDWWFEVCDLVRENESDTGYCDQCRPEQD